MTKRPDIWGEEKNKSNLGPAYDTVKSSFDRSGNKGATMGLHRTQKINNTPGPGSYSNADVISMVKSKGVSQKIGQTKRPDNFTKNDSYMPGPGNYATTDAKGFGRNVKGAASMGSKYKPTRNDNPAPGHYTSSQDLNKVSSSKNYGKIGTTKRPDLFESTKNSAPGPGNYADDKNNIGKNMKGVATMGSKHRVEKNYNPGPGQYLGVKSMKSTITSGKIGTTKRQDLWGESKQ